MERKSSNITSLVIGCCFAMTFLVLAFPAHGGTIGFTNGSFETVASAHTSSFTITNATDLPGWTASGGALGALDCVVFPGTGTTDTCGTGLKLWPGSGAPAISPDNVSPDKGNYIAFDGDSTVASTLSQVITGLVKDQSYVVSFFQAAAEQQRLFGGNGDTTEQWLVSLGSESHLSTLMMNKSMDFVDWKSESLTFTAQGPIETLSFLAVGTPNGLPPFVLLDGVSVADAPEPTTYTLIGIGLLGLVAVRRRLDKRG